MTPRTRSSPAYLFRPTKQKNWDDERESIYFRNTRGVTPTWCLVVSRGLEAIDMGQSRVADVLEELIRCHGSELQHIVLQITHDADAAQQVLQETYMAVLSRFIDEALPEIVRARAYLFSAAHKNACRYAKRAKNPNRPATHGSADVAADIADSSAGPERVALLTEAMRTLNTAINELTPQQREVFVLGKIRELPHREIAVQLKITERAVEKTMGRALTYLKGRLKQEGFDPLALGLDNTLPES
jgi:RNA polymerase sigma factor (sigma-70 family)